MLHCAQNDIFFTLVRIIVSTVEIDVHAWRIFFYTQKLPGMAVIPGSWYHLNIFFLEKNSAMNTLISIDMAMIIMNAWGCWAKGMLVMVTFMP